MEPLSETSTNGPTTQEKVDLCQAVMRKSLFADPEGKTFDAVRRLVTSGGLDEDRVSEAFSFLQMPEEYQQGVTLLRLTRKGLGRVMDPPNGRAGGEELLLPLLETASSNRLPTSLIADADDVINNTSGTERMEKCLRTLSSAGAAPMVAFWKFASKSHIPAQSSKGSNEAALKNCNVPLQDLLAVLDSLGDGGGILRLAGIEGNSSGAMSSRVAQLEKSHEELKAARDEAFAKLTKSQEETKSAHATAGAAQEDLKSAQEDLKSAQDDLRKAQDDLRKAQDELRKAQGELGSARTELKRAQDEVKTVNEKHAAAATGKTALEREREQLRKTLAEANVKLKNAADADKKKQLAERRERERLAKGEEQRLAEKKKMDADLASLHVTMQQIQQDRDLLQAETRRLQEALTAEEGKREKLQEKLNALSLKGTPPAPSVARRGIAQVLGQPSSPASKASVPTDPVPSKVPMQPAKPSGQDEQFSAFFKYIAKHPAPTP